MQQQRQQHSSSGSDSRSQDGQYYEGSPQLDHSAVATVGNAEEIQTQLAI
jgi:hypothetical protein